MSDRRSFPWAALSRRFGVDPRALATLRVAVGTLILADLALRSQSLVAFYTDAGVLPRAALRDSYPGIARLSLHALSGSLAFEAALFAVAGVAAVALAAGYRTRLATVLSLVLLASLHARNPLVLNAGDAVLRRLLLWGAFLPLGEVWSVDALRGRTSNGRVRADGSGDPDGDADPDGRWTERRVATLASAGLLCQVVVVYLANAVFKLGSDAWTEGVALRYVFGLDRITVGPGDALAGHPELLAVLGVAWLALLVSSVGLVALTGRARTALVCLFAGAHLAMALTMALGLFPLVSVAALLPFLPPAVWDRAERVGRRLRSRANGELPGAPRLGRLVDRLATGDGPRVRQARAPDPTPGPTDRYGPALDRWRGRIARAVVAVLLVSMLLWNGATLGYVDAPDAVEATVDPEERRWDMFAEPWRYGGWYVASAETASGREVDAMYGGSVDWDRPPEVAEAYPTHRWRMYLVDLLRSGNADLRPHLAAYLCRDWNGSHEEGLRSVSLYFVELHTRFDGPDEARRRHLLDHRCSGR